MIIAAAPRIRRWERRSISGGGDEDRTKCEGSTQDGRIAIAAFVSSRSERNSSGRTNVGICMGWPKWSLGGTSQRQRLPRIPNPSSSGCCACDRTGYRGSIGGKGKAWKFLLWRAIWSERIRRQSEHHLVQAHGRLPVWTSQFSNQAWDLYCGQEQRFSFSFAASTRSHEVNELDQRFETRASHSENPTILAMATL